MRLLWLLAIALTQVQTTPSAPPNIDPPPAFCRECLFETTFPAVETLEAGVRRTCAEIAQLSPGFWHNGTICSPNDYITAHGNFVTSGHPNGDEITGAANNPKGGGGNGFRHWRGDGQNVLGGGIKLLLSSANNNIPLNRFFIRFHMRYQAGFAFAGDQPDYTKDLYGLFTESPMPNWTFGFHAAHMWVWRGPGCGRQTTCGSLGWSNVMDGPTGDGLWHCYQLYIDATGRNDTVRAWVDRRPYLNSTNVDFGPPGGGLLELVVGSNQNAPANGGDRYTDYDDIAVSLTSMPPCLN